MMLHSMLARSKETKIVRQEETPGAYDERALDAHVMLVLP